MPEFDPDTDTVIEIAELDALRASIAAAVARAEAAEQRLTELEHLLSSDGREGLVLALETTQAAHAERSAKVAELQAENDALQHALVRAEEESVPYRVTRLMDSVDFERKRATAAVAAERARCAGLCRSEARKYRVDAYVRRVPGASVGEVACLNLAAAILAQPAAGAKGGE